MVAVFSDRSSAAEALLDGGAYVDAVDRAGRTALSYAAMYGSTDCIYLLANRGADVFHLDKDWNSPLDLAEDSGRQSAVDALKKLQMRVGAAGGPWGWVGGWRTRGQVAAVNVGRTARVSL